MQSRTLEVKRPAFRAAIEDVVHRLERTGVASGIRSPLDPGNADQISADRRSALVSFDIRGDPDTAVDRIDPCSTQSARRRTLTPTSSSEASA